MKPSSKQQENDEVLTNEHVNNRFKVILTDENERILGTSDSIDGEPNEDVIAQIVESIEKFFSCKVTPKVVKID